MRNAICLLPVASSRLLVVRRRNGEKEQAEANVGTSSGGLGLGGYPWTASGGLGALLPHLFTAPS